MKKFLIKLIPYVFGLIILHLFWSTYADGNTDENYRRFTVENSNNMIIGDSRSAQGIIPQILSENINDSQFFNFSFNIAESPYGTIYLEAIKKRIDKHTKEGIFIVSVNPWSITTIRNPDDKEYFSEEEVSCLRNMHFYDLKINYEYLIKNYNKSWYFLYRDSEKSGIRSKSYLHKNGWLEINIDMDSTEVEKRFVTKIKDYQEYAKSKKISKTRTDALKETIKFLQEHGKVFLVRLPTSKSIVEIEKNTYPESDVIFTKLSSELNVKYFNFLNEYADYQYTDGNHLYKESSKILTKKIADSVNKYK